MKRIIPLGREANLARSSYITYFTATYDDLVKKIGEPIYSAALGTSDKTQYEWAVEFEGHVFAIYDYKEYDRDVKKGLVKWHIGGFAEGRDIALQLIYALMNSSNEND